MTDRPLAKYENGGLWLDEGGVYQPTTRFSVLMRVQTFQHFSGPDAERYVRDCRAALAEYEKAMEEAKCEAATH